MRAAPPMTTDFEHLMVEADGHERSARRRSDVSHH
jgi:hypothetical protein